MSILMSKDDQCSKVFLVTDRPQVYDTINIKQSVLLLLKLLSTEPQLTNAVRPGPCIFQVDKQTGGQYASDS